MPVSVSCPACQKRYVVQPAALDKLATCPCGNKFRLSEHVEGFSEAMPPVERTQADPPAKAPTVSVERTKSSGVVDAIILPREDSAAGEKPLAVTVLSPGTKGKSHATSASPTRQEPPVPAATIWTPKIIVSLCCVALVLVLLSLGGGFLIAVALMEDGYAQPTVVAERQQPKRKQVRAKAKPEPKTQSRPESSPRPKRQVPTMIQVGDQVTSDETRYTAATAHQPLPFPKPETTGSSITKAKASPGPIEGLPYVSLDVVPVRPTHPHHVGYAPMAYSAEGEWMYLVGGDGVLHKVDADTLVEQRRLNTESDCSDLGLSSAGLVVVLSSTESLWVVDPDTLKVVREISVPGIYQLATSRSSSLATVLTHTDLLLVDLAQGRVVHQIPYKHAPGRTLTRQFSFHDLRQICASPDGRYVYLGGRKIYRLRVEGTDVFYDQVGQPDSVGDGWSLCLSHDGQRIAMPTGGSGSAIRVLDARDLDRTLVQIRTQGFSMSVGYDLTNGNFYALDRHQLVRLSPRGKVLDEWKPPGNSIGKIRVHPSGDRILLWAQDVVNYVDFRP